MLQQSDSLQTRSKPRRSAGAFILFIGSLLIVALLIAGYLTGIVKVGLNPVSDSETLVTQIQTLSRVETISYSMVKVFRYDQDANSFFKGIFGDHAELFIVPGKVIGGFDLANLNKKDITVKDKSITINLPTPQILETTLDESKIHIYDTNSGMATVLPEALPPNVTTQVIATAKSSLTATACQEGILQQASTSATRYFTSFLKSINFTSVTIHIPNATCPNAQTMNGLVDVELETP